MTQVEGNDPDQSAPALTSPDSTSPDLTSPDLTSPDSTSSDLTSPDETNHDETSVIGTVANGTVVVEATAYGPAALAALHRVVSRLKAEDPMRPVTVLAPSNTAGLAARRQLSRGVAGRPGVAALDVTTVSRWAERLAGTALAPRRPATRPVLTAAIRRALGESGGRLAHVASHPATVRAVAEAHTELAEVDEVALGPIGQTSAVAGEVVAVHRAVRARLAADWYEPMALVARAASEIPSWECVGPPGAPTCSPEGISERAGAAVVLYLPQRLTRSEITLLAAVAGAGRLSVVAGLGGDPRVDADVHRLLERLGARAAPAPTPPTATRVLTASDADDEVRGVVREVVSALRTTRADRVAVLYAARDPYARLLHEHLTSAGVRINGPGVRPVADRAVSRVLLGVLALASGDVPRHELFDAISDAPVRDHSGSVIPTSRWERITRSAGVVAGEDWQRRLEVYRTDLQRRAVAAEHDWQRDRLVAQQQDTADLQRFATGLRGSLRRASTMTTWAELSTWCAELFTGLLGEVEELSGLPAEERYAAATIVSTLRAVADLGAVEPSASLAVLADVLAVELDRAVPRQGRFGEGVFVGPIAAAIGIDTDLVHVVGLSEDLCPGRLREDPLLGPDARIAAEGMLAGPRERLDTQHRHVLAALAAAPQVVASFARGDLRRSAERLPSRWLLPTLRRLGERPDLTASRWAEVATGPRVRSAPSFAGELLRSPALATEQEWRIRAAASGGLTDERVESAHALQQARSSRAFTRFDGNLAGADGLPDFAHDDVAVAPTVLEGYAACPHAYFTKRLLRVEPVEQPEDVVKISALDLGNLVHESLDQLVAELRGAGQLPGFGEPWTHEQRARLGEITARRAAEMEQRGLTGHPRLWAQEWRRVRLAMGQLLDVDDAHRAQHDSAVVRSELKFGQPEPVVEVTLPSGGRVRMKGSIDKIDRARDGTLHVIDLKTGRDDHYRKISTDTPLGDPIRLQLPVYGYAARQQLADRATPVQVSYWFVLRDRSRRSFSLTPAVEQTYAAALEVLVSSIQTGRFPHRPPETDFGWACPSCNPDGVGAGTQRDRWKVKREDAGLAPLMALLEPEGDRS